jgi:hypothetical protein
MAMDGEGSLEEATVGQTQHILDFEKRGEKSDVLGLG